MEKTILNWSDINSDLLTEIADRIKCLRDFIIFGAVCKSWRSVATPEIFNKSTKVPWLLLDQDKYYGHSPRKFLNLSKDVIYTINLGTPRKVRLSITDWKFLLVSFIKENKYFMCSKGWYLIVENQTQLSLLNPFSLSRIDLPHPFPFSKDYGINEVIQPVIMNFALSSSPNSSSDFTIMIIYRINPTRTAELAFWKNGDRKWTDIDLIFSTYFVDMTYHNGQYYAAHPSAQHMGFPNRYVVHEIDIRNSASVSIRTKSFTISSRKQFRQIPFWIVGSSRVLMMVALSSELYWECDPCYSNEPINYQQTFIVEEVDFENGESKEMSNFGDEALFLGFKSSYFADVSKESRFKPNHIYFADNFKKSFWWHKGGVGVYSMIDGSSTRLFSESDSGYGCSSQWIEPRP
ncbi:putative F-box protein At5g55150 [Mercurialis annua]|uniref:putative F-box protein At5g55150 n=1 Tax=Mercurialis annua TaxID=3986 RepID=UPI00215F9425|nr:putative F-box protein At5g55150 [Mercurialis annua]